MGFSIFKKVNGTIDEVETKLSASLKENGFGILTRVEVDTTLKEKIGEIVAPYRILGACNPKLAHQALQAEPSLGVFLPCSICIRQEPDQTVSIWALDPSAVLETVENPDLAPHGELAKNLIQGAIDRL